MVIIETKPYTILEVETMLNSSVALDASVPLWNENLKKEINFRQKWDFLEKIDCGILPFEKIIGSRMYVQHLPGFCLPWAVANSNIGFDLKPSVSLMESLFNENVSRRNTSSGLPFNRAAQINNRLNENFKMQKLKEPLLTTTRPEFLYDEYFQTLTAEPFIKYNARQIKFNIDHEIILLEGVDHSIFIGDRLRPGIHAICIVGYRVDTNHYMNVVVRDGARGQLFVPIEHLSASILQDTFTVSRI